MDDDWTEMHRDNYKAEQMREVAEGSKAVEDLVEGSHHGGDANSQIIGSNVLVYTDGSVKMPAERAGDSAARSTSNIGILVYAGILFITCKKATKLRYY